MLLRGRSRGGGPRVSRTPALRPAIVAAVTALLLVGPAAALAHSLDATYQSRLPLVVYLIGAAMAVALSFAFLLLADVRADPPPAAGPGRLPPALAPDGPAGRRADRLGVDRPPGHLRRR